MAEATKLRVQIETIGLANLSKLKSALQSVDGIAKQVDIDFKQVRRELQQKNKSMVRSVENVSKLKTSYQELARSVEFGSKQFKVATERVKQLDRELAKMEKRGPSAKQRLGGIAKGVGAVAGAGVFGGPEGAIGALLGLPFGLPGAIAGGAIGAQVGTLRKSIGQVAELRAQFDLMRVALAGVSNDMDDFEDGMTAVREISDQFLIPQTEVIQKFVQLKAAVRGAGFDTETTTTVFKGLAAAVLSTGGSVEDTSAALRAAAQVFSKGKVSAEELRQQIGERLPGAFTQFAASMGISSQQLDKALEDGEVRLDNFVVFTQDLLKIYEKNSEAIASAPEAAGRRLRVALINMGLNYGGFFTKVGSGFQDFFTKIIELFNKNEKEIKMTFARIALALDDLLPVLKKFAKKATEILGPVVQFKIRNIQFLANLISQLNETGKINVEEAAKDLDATSERLLAKYKEMFGETSPTVFGGFRVGFDEGGTEDQEKGLGKRKDISFELREAQIAVMREENEERRLALEFEARILEIREAGYEQNVRAVQLEAALKTLRDGRAKIEEERAEALKKALNNTAAGLREVHSIFRGGDIPDQPEQKNFFESMADGARNFAQSLGTIQEAAQKVAEVGLRGLGDAITELVVTGTMNFRQFAASLLSDLARIIMQQVVVATLMQAIFPGKGLGLGSITKGVNFANPLGFKPIQQQEFGVGLPQMAKGGITRGVSIAGEAGPEAVVPLPDGRSIPVRMQGEGTKVVVNVDASGTAAQGDTGRARQLGDAIGSAVRQELLKQKRPGGLLA